MAMDIYDGISISYKVAAWITFFLSGLFYTLLLIKENVEKKAVEKGAKPQMKTSILRQSSMKDVCDEKESCKHDILNFGNGVFFENPYDHVVEDDLKYILMGLIMIWSTAI